MRLVPVTREGFDGKKCRQFTNYSFASPTTLVPIVGAELSQAVKTMPLAFVEESERFVLVAVLSLTPDRNMMVAPDGRWLGSYIPAAFRGYPFFLRRRSETGQPILCIDVDSGLVSDSEGEDFFTPDGKLSPSIGKALDFLGQIDRYRMLTDAAVAALAAAGVIQPWQIKQKTGQREVTLTGLHQVDEAALNKLPDDGFVSLRKALALPIAYAQLFSMAQVSLFEQLAKIQADLTPVPVSRLPETLDSVFGISTNDDLIRF